jgi:hypothetical protein
VDTGRSNARRSLAVITGAEKYMENKKPFSVLLLLLLPVLMLMKEGKGYFAF